MADISLKAAPVLGGVNLDFETSKIVELTDIALVSVAVPQNGEEALSEKLKTSWGISLPDFATSSEAGALRAIPMTQDQFLLAFSPDPNLSEASIRSDLAQVAYTTLQTDAWVILELSGPGAVAALERICPIDLDIGAFKVGASARTTMEHLGACIVRVDVDRFWLMSARSSARSFLHAVETSCRWTAT